MKSRIKNVKVSHGGRGKGVLYVWPDGESFWANFVNRKNRPFKVYRQFLPEIMKKAGLPKDAKARWSQKAGCSCGCSPGFVLTGRRGITIDATLVAEKAEVLQNDGQVNHARVAVANRLAQGELF